MNTTEQQQAQPAPRLQWIRPRCHFCKKGMLSTSHKTIVNDRTGQVYIETKYICPDCDFRQTNAVPRKLALTIVDEDCLPVLPQATEPAQA